MNKVAFSAAILNTRAFGHKSLAATDTNLFVSTNGRITAFPRTILKAAMRSFARVELLTAMSADRRTAIITDFSATRTRGEILTTFSARDNRINNREWVVLRQFGMTAPKLLLRYPMTGVAKRNQIIKMVSLTVVSKQAKRSNVMNREPSASHAAMLARVVVSFACRRSLPIPVRAAIVGMPAKPRRIIYAAVDAACRTVLVPAFTTAKITVKNLARCFLELRTTVSARYHYALSPAPYVVFGLPSGVTLKTAKRVLCQSDMIPSALDSFSTLSTSYCDHTFYYSTCGQLFKGAFCNG